MGAQCAHAAVSCVRTISARNEALVRAWELRGQPKIVVRANEPGEASLLLLAQKASQLGITTCIVRDAGKTQLPSGTATVLGIGPADSTLVDQVTAKHKLF